MARPSFPLKQWADTFPNLHFIADIPVKPFLLVLWWVDSTITAAKLWAGKLTPWQPYLVQLFLSLNRFSSEYALASLASSLHAQDSTSVSAIPPMPAVPASTSSTLLLMLEFSQDLLAHPWRPPAAIGFLLVEIDH